MWNEGKTQRTLRITWRPRCLLDPRGMFRLDRGEGWPKWLVSFCWTVELSWENLCSPGRTGDQALVGGWVGRRGHITTWQSPNKLQVQTLSSSSYFSEFFTTDFVSHLSFWFVRIVPLNSRAAALRTKIPANLSPNHGNGWVRVECPYCWQPHLKLMGVTWPEWARCWARRALRGFSMSWKVGSAPYRSSACFTTARHMIGRTACWERHPFQSNSQLSWQKLKSTCNGGQTSLLTVQGAEGNGPCPWPGMWYQWDDNCRRGAPALVLNCYSQYQADLFWK